MIATTRKEITAVLTIWALLMLLACATVFVLNRQALHIINHIEYETGNRYAKAMVLYTEAEIRAAKALQKNGNQNAQSTSQKLLSYSDPDLSASLSLLKRAFALDPRRRFDPNLEKFYRLQGDLHGIAGENQEQSISYARAFLCTNDINNARQYTQRVLAGHETEAAPRLLDAELQYASGQHDSAKQILESLTQSTTASVEARKLLSHIYTEQKQIEPAIAQLEKALSDEKTNIDVRKNLALLQAAQGKTQDALKTLKDGIELGGQNDGNYLHIYGEMLRSQPDRVKDGVKVLEEAAKLEPNSGDVFLTLAKAYEAAGSKRRASEALQRALALKPELQKEVIKP